MIEHTADISKLAEALAAAQGELRNVPRDETNPHFKHRYASLEAVIETVRPVLSKHGLAFTQAPGGFVDNSIAITTMLLHKEGQWLKSTLYMPIVKRDAQGVGSAITYGLRYSLMAVLGVAPTDDDDAQSAGEAPAQSPDKRPLLDRLAERDPAYAKVRDHIKDREVAQTALTDDALPLDERLIMELERRPTAEAVVRLFEAPKFKAKYEELDNYQRARVDDAERRIRNAKQAIDYQRNKDPA